MHLVVNSKIASDLSESSLRSVLAWIEQVADMKEEKIVEITVSTKTRTKEENKGRITKKTSVLSDSSSQPCEGRYMLKKFIFVF